ncbi:Rv3235 family protein [Ornithinimicrobium sp. Y1847]|uniref:Rv3235 family protein n=1 Tax=Ornithinimicrobium sp. Y1847 TaxID=3405419 RepID=UPI003B67D018
MSAAAAERPATTYLVDTADQTSGDQTSADQTARRSGPSVLRIVPAPRTDPASSGPDWGERERPPAPESFVQGTLAVDFQDSEHDAFFGPQLTRSRELPEPQLWGRRMVQAILEVQDGTRGADQLGRWVIPDIKERARRRGALARRRGRRTHRPPIIRTMLCSEPADGVCELSLVVWADGRIRALAVRISGVDGRWLVTAWEMG